MESYVGAMRSYCRVLDEKILLIKRNKILVLCAIALSLDPLFCYILVVHDDKKCLGLDRTLRTIAIVSRSVIDFLYILHIIFQFCATRSVNPVDILAILPLPQVLIFAIIPKLNNLRVLKATRSLNFIFIFQYVLRFLRICSLLKKDLGASGILAKSTWANLFFFMLASHVIGAFWYLFSIERKATCWIEACSHVGVHCSLYCNDTYKASLYLNDYCSKNSTSFDFGIYVDALASGVVDSADIVQRISYCFWWGLQNLSSLGQGLKTSTYVWEIYFSIFILISGLLSFAFLIGNVQAYLLSEVAKSEERRVRVEQMRLKRQEMESWRPFLSFPENLREQILQNIECKLQENILVDVHNFLPHLSMDLRKDTIRHLGMDLFKKCPAFDKWDRRLLDAMCDSLKPVIYTEESYIFQERGTVDAMHFIAQGRLMRLTTYGATTEAFLYRYLGYGDYCGEELITWAFDPHSSPIELPSSIATVQSLSKVLALVLKADDLKLIASQFRHLHDIHHARHTFRVYSNQWRTWAACYIQRVWRRYCKMKLEKSLEQQNGRLKEALAKDGTSSSSLGDNI
uniref:cyclic nucleotide-gated ion channel 1-like n=1 Tax=Fragaria vesca subsp. vesca TaxID=101020 RepID=UPI0005C7FBC1|nr:PREDICTED: cyclic nucleotide-gated ion channel 1-like [Fragaria vesca subsp. vesca]XP_011463625.1 PREDICTED: cyclic nucleotide-gated ion channel 1-like [Fragaria vesca subsp. vesca]